MPQRNTDKPPRPQNAWILYRRDRQTRYLAENPDGPKGMSEISKAIAAMWKKEPEEVKRAYKELAKEAEAKHKIQYPGYKYEPRARRGEPKKSQKTAPYAVPSQPALVGGAPPQSNLVWTYTPASTPPSSSGSTPTPAAHSYAGTQLPQFIPVEPPYHNRGLPQGFNAAAGPSVAPTQITPITFQSRQIPPQNLLPTPSPGQQTYASQIPTGGLVQYGYDPVGYTRMLQTLSQQRTQAHSVVPNLASAYAGAELNNPQTHWDSTMATSSGTLDYALSSASAGEAQSISHPSKVETYNTESISNNEDLLLTSAGYSYDGSGAMDYAFSSAPAEEAPTTSPRSEAYEIYYTEPISSNEDLLLTSTGYSYVSSGALDHALSSPSAGEAPSDIPCSKAYYETSNTGPISNNEDPSTGHSYAGSGVFDHVLSGASTEEAQRTSYHNAEPISDNGDPLLTSTVNSYMVPDADLQAFLAHTRALAEYQSSLIAFETEARHSMLPDAEASTDDGSFDSHSLILIA